MSWNYRLCDHGTHLALHEVFYDKRGKVTGWTIAPVTFVGDEPEDIIVSLERALDDARTRPLLTCR